MHLHVQITRLTKLNVCDCGFKGEIFVVVVLFVVVLGSFVCSFCFAFLHKMHSYLWITMESVQVALELASELCEYPTLCL